jgi:galactokinase
MDLPELKAAFAGAFGREPAGAVRAPGRVNLIGEHTDYNDGFVLPIAIEKQTLAAWAPRADGRMRFVSAQGSEADEIDLEDDIRPGPLAWSNYVRGVAAAMCGEGAKLVGCDLYFTSDVPLGGGLSSSASLEVAAAVAMLSAAKLRKRFDPGRLAEICQWAENLFAGSPCGIMDQTIAVRGREGRALLLDCLDGRTRQVPFDDPAARLLVVNTLVRHGIADGAYGQRRAECEQAAELLGVASLRELDGERLQQARDEAHLDPTLFRRARHVVGEIERTLAAADLLARGEMEGFGALMYDSHASLREDYEVSCAELDRVVETATAAEGVWGARMTGGGFGGCAIVLVRADRAEAVRRAIEEDFQSAIGHAPQTFFTRAAAGAERLKLR